MSHSALLYLGDIPRVHREGVLHQVVISSEVFSPVAPTIAACREFTGEADEGVVGIASDFALLLCLFVLELEDLNLIIGSDRARGPCEATPRALEEGEEASEHY